MSAAALVQATVLSSKSVGEVIAVARELNKEAKRICAEVDNFFKSLQAA